MDVEKNTVKDRDLHYDQNMERSAGSQFFPNWERDFKNYDENSTQEQKRRPN
jgi:hypothetical protein